MDSCQGVYTCPILTSTLKRKATRYTIKNSQKSKEKNVKVSKRGRGMKMVQLKELQITNVQSIDDITIHFDKTGVFHLAGPNNVGKSVIVKAIRLLFLNVSNNQYREYLRDGCETMTVTGVMWSGDVLKLSRGVTDYYEWNIGRKKGRVDRTGGRVPAEVEEYVKMYVDTDKTKECLNIRMPRSVLLFVDTTPGDNAYLLQRALGTEEYLASMKLSERKRREVVKEKKIVEDYRGREEEKLKAIEGVVSENAKHLESVEGYGSVMEQEYAAYLKIEEIVNVAVGYQNAQLEMRESKSKIDSLNIGKLQKEMEVYEDVAVALSMVRDISKINRRKKETDEILESFKEKEFERELEVLKDIAELLEYQNNMEATEAKLLKTVVKVSDEDLKSLKDAIVELQVVGSSISVEKDCTATKERLSELTERMESVSVADLRNALRESAAVGGVLSSAVGVNKLKKSVEATYVAYEKKDMELVEFMKENKFCPIVARTLNKECPFKAV